MYGSSSPQLQHQQFQQLPPYSRTESSSSGYGSGGMGGGLVCVESVFEREGGEGERDEREGENLEKLL